MPTRRRQVLEEMGRWCGLWLYIDGSECWACGARASEGKVDVEE